MTESNNKKAATQIIKEAYGAEAYGAAYMATRASMPTTGTSIYHTNTNNIINDTTLSKIAEQITMENIAEAIIKNEKAGNSTTEQEAMLAQGYVDKTLSQKTYMDTAKESLKKDLTKWINTEVTNEMNKQLSGTFNEITSEINSVEAKFRTKATKVTDVLNKISYTNILTELDKVIINATGLDDITDKLSKNKYTSWLATPFVSVITASLASVNAVVQSTEMYKYIKGLQEKFTVYAKQITEFITDIKNTFSAIQASINAIRVAVYDTAKKIVNELTDGIKTIIADVITGIISGVTGAISDIFSGALTGNKKDKNTPKNVYKDTNDSTHDDTESNTKKRKQ